MKMTKWRRAVLLRYKELREKPPTTLSLLRRNWPRFVLRYSPFVAVFGVFAYVDWTYGNWTFSTLMLGMIAGMFASDLGWMTVTVRGWKLLKEIIDWNRVDELLAQSEECTPPRSA